MLFTIDTRCITDSSVTMPNLRVLLKAKCLIVPVLAVLLGVTLSNGFGLKKLSLKALDFVKEFESTNADCYPPSVDKESFLVEILIALATGFIHTKEKVKCFPSCLLKHYKIMNELGEIQYDVAKSFASRIIHAKMKDIVLDNLDACNATVYGSSDVCLNGLTYTRCFAKLGVFVYANPDDSQYPTADDPKSKFMKFMRKMAGGESKEEKTTPAATTAAAGAPAVPGEPAAETTTEAQKKKKKKRFG